MRIFQIYPNSRFFICQNIYFLDMVTVIISGSLNFIKKYFPDIFGQAILIYGIKHRFVIKISKNILVYFSKIFKSKTITLTLGLA